MSATGRESQDRLLSTFLDLVRIYSPSGSEASCASYCAQALREAGCEVCFDDSSAATGSDTGNLIAVLKGDEPVTLVLSAHMDVVEPCRDVEPVITDGIVHSAGDTVLGGDDRAGLAAAIECVRRLGEAGLPHPTVKCIFTVMEEVGLIGAKQLRDADVAGTLCLVLDVAGSPGGLVVAAPTHYTFTADFTGRAAHAGVEPEAGVSALSMAALAVCEMPMGRIDEATTANVGSIEGSGPTNVVCATARVTGECRSLDRATVEQVRSKIDSALTGAASAFGGAVDVSWNLEYEGFRVADGAESVEIVTGACGDLGLDAVTFSTGGGSDANIISALGVPTLALSCGMTGVHGTDEEIAVADLSALTDLCVTVARRLSGELS